MGWCGVTWRGRWDFNLDVGDVVLVLCQVDDQLTLHWHKLALQGLARLGFNLKCEMAKQKTVGWGYSFVPGSAFQNLH